MEGIAVFRKRGVLFHEMKAKKAVTFEAKEEGAAASKRFDCINPEGGRRDKPCLCSREDGEKKKSPLVPPACFWRARMQKKGGKRREEGSAVEGGEKGGSVLLLFGSHRGKQKVSTMAMTYASKKGGDKKRTGTLFI